MSSICFWRTGEIRMYKSIFKPLLDRLAALLLLLLLAPVLIITALILFIKMGRPIIFTQARPGYQGKIFTIYKFRSMSNERGEDGKLLSDKERLKGIGQKIRSLSLDELPQLFNVLKGDMSFIGPRPLLVEYLPLYTPTQAKRHDVKPGITGWAQVNGRNAISWEEKFRYDVDYVNQISLKMDLKIAYLTALRVIKKEGISQDGNVTMEKFKGGKK
ncbi:MAG: undecaprenyl phosphate N,N-diacetylbacillosamine 1-phosphate transferase [Campylobacterota bacterium]|nr:undecaprenyl phosphate N,N-diacetylbacillosamine 1-phosphate transferase [Campylobacterota bacterium]